LDGWLASLDAALGAASSVDPFSGLDTALGAASTVDPSSSLDTALSGASIVDPASATDPFTAFWQGLEQDWISSPFGSQVDGSLNAWAAQADPAAFSAAAGDPTAGACVADL